MKPTSSSLVKARSAGRSTDRWGREYEWKKGDYMLRCQRFMPRSARTTTSFLPQETALYVPAQLCRMTLTLAEHQVPPTRNSGASVWYQLSSKDNELVALRCRTD